MTMTFAFHDDFAFDETTAEHQTISSKRQNRPRRKPLALHLIEEKIKVPKIEKGLKRQRINELLEKLKGNFAASLLSGRAQTGKTYAAADFAKSYKNVAWYTIDSSDSSWEFFSAYFSASLRRAVSGKKPRSTKRDDKPASENEISDYLFNLFAATATALKQKPMLIVLDEAHHVFDTDWFADFFNLLLYSLLPNMHLLILCRSKPPLPLWRLRSKQILNVIDEKTLAFDPYETEMFCRRLGHSDSVSKQAYWTSFGQIGKIIEFVNASAA